jgi:ribonuclease P protein component
MRGERFLTKPQQYEKVYSHGTSRTSGPVVLKVMPNGLDISRYGISVSRRVGNAVTRNHVKRRLRELLRVIALKPGWDLVFIARPSAAQSNFPRLADNLRSLLVRDKIIESGDPGSSNDDPRKPGFKIVDRGVIHLN